MKSIKMASKRRLRKNSCTGKFGHSTRTTAKWRIVEENNGN